MTDFARKRCVPCEGTVEPLSRELAELNLESTPGWHLREDTKLLSREFTFPDFMAAMAFVDQVADIAEEEDHHPDIALSWGKVGISMFTHSVGGLSENDFILAVKINGLQN